MEHCRGSLVREGGSLESYWCPAPQEFKSLPRRHIFPVLHFPVNAISTRKWSVIQIHQEYFTAIIRNNGSVHASYHCFYVVEPLTVQVRDTRGSSMCVAVPAEVIEIKEGNIGLVDYGDLRQEVRLDLVDVKVGEFVLVHVGYAIQRLSREEGLETREIFKQVYAALEN
jgi:hydrogenase expression/formation protein HypC